MNAIWNIFLRWCFREKSYDYSDDELFEKEEEQTNGQMEQSIAEKQVKQGKKRNKVNREEELDFDRCDDNDVRHKLHQ